MLSIIIPTFNESQNILNLLNKIRDNSKAGTKVEVVVVDDNSPDGTGRLVEEYARGVGALAGMMSTIENLLPPNMRMLVVEKMMIIMTRIIQSKLFIGVVNTVWPLLFCEEYVLLVQNIFW